MNEAVQHIGKTRYLLVVDPDVNERFTMGMLLQRFGYTVATAGTVKEGIDFLCVAPAVAVFAEAGTLGSDLRTRLAEDVRFREVPLVLVADRPDRELEQSERQGGLSGLLRKPLNAESVFSIIQTVIEKGSRRNIRIATALPAVLRNGQDGEEGYVTVLSQYGLFFRILTPLPAGTRAVVEFALWDRVIGLEAEVLYGVTFEDGPFSEPGMGMKFLKVGLEDSSLIRSFIMEHVSGDTRPSGPEAGYRGGVA